MASLWSRVHVVKELRVYGTANNAGDKRSEEALKTADALETLRRELIYAVKPDEREHADTTLKEAIGMLKGRQTSTILQPKESPPMSGTQPGTNSLYPITIAGGAMFAMSLFGLLFPTAMTSGVAQWVVAIFGAIGGSIVAYRISKRTTAPQNSG